MGGVAGGCHGCKNIFRVGRDWQVFTMPPQFPQFVQKGNFPACCRLSLSESGIHEKWNELEKIEEKINVWTFPVYFFPRFFFSSFHFSWIPLLDPNFLDSEVL